MDIRFSEFKLDVANEKLWRGGQAITLRPKAFAVLKYLLERPGQLVSKDELLETVWPGAYVGDAVLKVCVGQLREALGDDPKSPRFIETSHRRGYRFVGEVTSAGRPPDAANTQQISGEQEERFDAPPPSNVVGREAALERMRGWLDKALRGERQIVFVTGEAGLGKTTLVETFLEGAAGPGIGVGRGQCLEHYGVGEAYLPVLEAITHLAQEPGGGRLIEHLRHRAPTWLAQMPSLIMTADRDLFERLASGATRERMLREMAEALEALTAESALVLVIEDLHWSDYSTLDLISYLARRREAARLMLIGTYRPVEVILSGHPLKAVKQEMSAHKLCQEMNLEFLTEGAVAEYLAARFGGSEFSTELARLIYDRTDGNPLFMVNVVDYLIAQGLIVQSDGRWELKVAVEQVVVGVPDGARQMIDKQIDHLSPEQQQLLEAASVAGLEFPAEAVAAGLEKDVMGIEERCEELARQHQFIRGAGVSELPDGTVTARYKFIHALYQNALYERASAARLARLHQRIGARGEDAYGARASEIAGELAMHFERGRDFRRAAKYLAQAAENATRRFAYQEALALSRRGLELIERLPETPERAQQELTLRIALGVPLIMTSGYGSAEVERCHERALELCERLGERLELFPELWELTRYYQVRSPAKAAQVTSQLLGLAARGRDAAVMIQAHYAMGASKLYLGEFDEARQHLERGLELYDPQKHYSQAILYVHDPGVMLRGRLAYAMMYLGYPEQALGRCHEAVAIARQMSYPFTLAFALCTMAVLRQFRRERREAKELAESVIALSSEYGFQYNLGLSEILLGWALAEEGDVEEGPRQIRKGLDHLESLGAEMFRPHGLCLLAEVYRRRGQAADGLAALAEASAAIERSGESYYEAELHRIRGELLLESGADGAAPEAEASFWRAISIARKQRAKSCELRAAMSLGRLYLRRGEDVKARQELADVHGWFTEGFDTADMKEAGELLDKL